jgi:hypothetical protein
MSKELLRQIGELVFGAEWQAPLARDLDVAERTMRRWASGSDNVPTGVWRDILIRLERLQALVQQLMAQVRKMITSTAAGAGSQSHLVEEWKSLIADVQKAALGIFATANVQITEYGFADAKVVALTLLARTHSNMKGAKLLVDAKRVVEARTITRSVFENLYWIVAVAEEGQSFVRKMRDDDMSHRLAQGQSMFATEIALEEEVREQLRTFLRTEKPRFENAKSLSPKQVAGIRRDFEKTYVFYGQLSSDAAHPSTTALCRHLVPESHPDGAGIDVEPVVSEGELAETCEYLCMASVGVCVAVNQILGGTAAGEVLNNIADRYTELSNRTKAEKISVREL